MLSNVVDLLVIRTWQWGKILDEHFFAGTNKPKRMIFVDCLQRFSVMLRSIEGREPWSSSYGRGLPFRRSWVWILAPYTGWTFFTNICYKNYNDVCLKRPKINDKRGWAWPILKSSIEASNYCVHIMPFFNVRLTLYLLYLLYLLKYLLCTYWRFVN